MRTTVKAGRVSRRRDRFESARTGVPSLPRLALPRWTGRRDGDPALIVSVAGVLIGALGLVRGVPLIVTFVEAGLVPRWSSTLLSVGLLFLGASCVAVGHVLDLVAEARQEVARLVLSTHPSAEQD